MRSYCLCESQETLTAMRLGGIEGKLIHSDEEAKSLIDQLIKDSQIALIMVSENIHNRIKPYIMPIKLACKHTLIIQIPETDGLKDKDYIMKYIKNSIGLKL